MRKQQHWTSPAPAPLLPPLRGLRALGYALPLVFGLGAEPVLAETALQVRFTEFQARVEQTARALAREPRFRPFSERERTAGFEFMIGNMVFVAAHEMGHAVISELNLSVLGREEDAADSFAIVGALKGVGNEFSYRVLQEAAKGWFWSARRDKEAGELPTYYGEHGLDEQRAYRIVCLMVGFDPVKFKPLADATKLPEDRRRTCAWDFDTAARSWQKAVAPHRLAPGQPKTPITVSYGEAEGDLGILARWFRDIGFLEIFADIFTERYAWPAPITLEMRSCGESRARWTVPLRKLHICYEMAQEFAELYRDYGRDRKLAKRKTGDRYVVR